MQRGINISHVLSFNEPDGPYNTGGSNMQPSKAAEAWVRNIVPLQAMGIKVGLPACTGGRGGIPWLQQFLGNCSQVLTSSTGGGETKNCTYDFIPLHWYGNFEGMASHIGEYSAAFPKQKFWITEFNLERQDLPTTQAYYNSTISYLDSLDSIERYTMFGAFRSGVSNIGPNAAFLNNDGKLTDMGSWYLGGSATGVLPTSGSLPGSPSAANRLSASIVAIGVAVTATGSMLMFPFWG
ncbi:glycosyl hydrolase catalytic core-domain-containing protein [Microdochium trichocladiopsis]|uniref:Glycosyl hydrolase catalytic core-domain-containing protein n=1 Tax=Microdochium trichocladiopsis TaxID=1682393 RepID=A0A9P8Y7S9_9PEZI|nr:glycosyl hydrolase catalytic core-domain-containing protein [Microdochium trichocladiopsis]KAH7031438.1 glycosyl hydrolase catalytic core-domain-containing protein [Microdochium trichocladiopsis]